MERGCTTWYHLEQKSIEQSYRYLTIRMKKLLCFKIIRENLSKNRWHEFFIEYCKFEKAMAIFIFNEIFTESSIQVCEINQIGFWFGCLFIKFSLHVLWLTVTWPVFDMCMLHIHAWDNIYVAYIYSFVQWFCWIYEMY